MTIELQSCGTVVFQSSSPGIQMVVSAAWIRGSELILEPNTPAQPYGVEDARIQLDHVSASPSQGRGAPGTGLPFAGKIRILDYRLGMVNQLEVFVTEPVTTNEITAITAELRLGSICAMAFAKDDTVSVEYEDDGTNKILKSATTP